MKKFQLAFVLLLTILAGNTAFAQYEKGDKLLNAGLGFGAYYGGGLPIGASLEFGITDDISVGAQADFYTWSYSSFWRYTFLPIGVRGSYHLNKIINLNNDKLDFYAGAGLGYRIASYKYDGPGGSIVNDSYGSRPFFGIHVGARYYFKPNLGGFAEAGYGVAPLKFGLAVKF